MQDLHILLEGFLLRGHSWVHVKRLPSLGQRCCSLLQPAAVPNFFFCLCVLLNPELLQLFWVAVCCELFYSTSSRFLLPLFVGMRRTEGKPVKRNKEITCSRSDCSQGRLLKASTSMP